MIGADLLLPRNMRGAKWFNGASYITDEDRRKVIDAIARAKQCVDDPRSVGVRVPAYTGEPHPIVAITYNGGASLYGFVYKTGTDSQVV